MELIPITTATAKEGTSIVDSIANNAVVQDGDILVVSSKYCAMCGGSLIAMDGLEVSDTAKMYAEQVGRSPEFMQAVLNECERRNGMVVGTCPDALLCELRPEGLPEGTIFTANAGLDESNTPVGTCIGWPDDPVQTVSDLAMKIEQKFCTKNAIILTDSCCSPRRKGVTAFALTVSGMDPLMSEEGNDELFGRQLHITTEAVADQLATAANALMGNAAQATPMVIVRNHPFTLSNFCGWVPGIEPKDDLFQTILAS